MKYSNLYEIPTSRDIVSAFAGYNHNLRIADEEFYDMRNLTSDHYPCLSPRDKRGTYSYSYDDDGTVVTTVPEGVKGIIAKDSLCWVQGSKFYINGYGTEMLLDSRPKQLISMGAYVIVMPDKKWINTKNRNYGSIDHSYVGSVMPTTVSYRLCNADGDDYTDIAVRNTAPSDASEGKLWMDTSSNPHILKKWSATDTMWVVIPSTFVKISAPGIGAGFERYDGVTINGVEPEQLQELNGKTSVIYASRHKVSDPANDYIVVTGILDNPATQEVNEGDPFLISRQMPAMDFVIEAGNRLWGCRYGLNNAGEVVNEIYASKLGDFKNWECFMGVSTDSYAASVGTDGPFTGAITHLGYPLFFKEECLHKVYGNYPANFQIQQTACRGVQKGAGNSLAIVNEKLYYKSRNGVCVYDGSLPYEISAAFGNVKYSAVDETDTDFLRNGAVAGGFNNKYYVSMRSEADNEWYFFVFDSSVGMWHKEDNFRAVQITPCRGDIYAIEATNGTIVSLLGSGMKEAQDIRWSAETGVLGLTSKDRLGRSSTMVDKKCISRIVVRMSLAVGARVRFSVQYDSQGDWEHLATVVGRTLQTFPVSLKPRRCDHFRLLVEGVGEAKIYSIAKTLEQGSDV